MVGGGGVGNNSHFRVQPNYSVEVVLCCPWGCDKKLCITNIIVRGTSLSRNGHVSLSV